MTERYSVVGSSLLVISSLLVASVIIIMAAAAAAAEQQTSHAQVKQRLSKTMLQEFPVPSGSRPHDVAPSPGKTVWYTAQGSGELGRLEPSTGKIHSIALGHGSDPHGVIVGPDGAPWVTDGGLNAIVRVDPVTESAVVSTTSE
jgi:virginiamycin B lyase